MTAETHSFIDIAAIDAVRGHFAAGDGVIILTPDLGQVIWSNGAGASLLGFSGVEAAIGADSGLSHAARRQIENVPGYPVVPDGRPVTVRLATGMISQATPLRVASLLLPGDEAAIMLVAEGVKLASRPAEETAGRAIRGFEEVGNYVAMLDGDAGILAATPGFEELGLQAHLLKSLVADAAGERVLKRIVRAGNRAMPVGFARLADEPARFLLITVDEATQEADAEEAREAASPPVVDDSQAVAPQAGKAETEQAAADEIPFEATQDGAAQESQDAPVATAEVGETPASAASDGPDKSETPGVQHDSWYFSDRAGAAAPGAIAALGADVNAAPVRFVWRTDAEGRFSSMSAEFAAAVGAAAGDVIGKSFAEVAGRLGLDPDGEIAGLLERRDTWSGRSVFWPIAGTDLKAPVDLAALPAYDRDRKFEGFRGFGVIRVADAVIDPSGLGLSLVEQPEEPAAVSPEPEPAADLPDDPFQGEVPALEISPGPERRYSDKVVNLAEHRAAPPDKGLTPLERNAFREIGEQLKRASAPQEGVSREAPEPTEPAGADDVEAAPADEPHPAIATQEIAAPEAAAPPVQANDAEPAIDADAPAEAEPAMADEDEAPADAIADDESATEGVADEDAAPSTDAGDLPRLPDETVPQDRVSRSLLDFASPAGSDESAEEEGASIVGETPDAPAATAEPAPSAATPPAEATVPARHDFIPSAFAERRADTSILAQLPIPVLIHSGDTLHYANDAFLELTAYETLDQLAGAGGLDVLFSGPAANRGEGDNRLVPRTRAGDELPVTAHLRSVPWLGGKALLLTLIRQPAPATPAPGAEQEPLKDRLAELRTILDTATDGVVLIDNDATIRSISRPAEALFGYDGDQLVGRPFTSLFAIESQRSARDYLSGLSDNGVASVLNDGREVIGREAQGRFIPLFMTIGRLPGNGGFCAVLRDITQWKRAEEELTQARAQAERVSTQKSDFLARVSHEIRTPLNAIIGFSELMLDEKFGPIVNDRYRDYLRDINRSGNHVLDLVNDLLDISKIEAGQQEMDYQAVALNDALSETVAMMQPQANRERVIIRSSFASKLPEVVADLRSVRQIALNILSNAVRYTQAGGQVIVSTAHEANGEVVMRVRDTGVGMTQAEIEQALKPFKQVNALKRGRGDGTGLGLPLTKAMVEANRAKFALYSTPGEGTLVEVTFPATRVLAE